MTTPRFDIRSYVFDPQASYFLDANVWLSVYGPLPPNDHRAKVYSHALKRLRGSGAKVFIDVLVASELVNGWSRIEFEAAGGRSRFSSFKDFRNDPTYVPVAGAIAASLRSILAFAQRTGTPFANINFDDVLADFTKGGLDLNDHLIVDGCRAKGHILVTHDGDMKSAPVPVVTANAALLA